MASVLQRSVKLSVAAAANAQQQQVLVAVRGFAAKKKASKKSSKKGGEDTNFELMLRNIKGRYPEAYVHRVSRCVLACLYSIH